MQDFSINQLEKFLKEAFSNCYLGEFKRAETTERSAFFEMEYEDNDWLYRDSFTGFYSSTGQEIIRYKGIPVWSSNYGGGVIEKYIGDAEFFTVLEAFLIKSLSQKENQGFFPRGPKLFEDNDWTYKCDWDGKIESFNGVEEILFNNEKVFEHRFFGGTITGFKTTNYLSYLMGSDSVTDSDLESLQISINEMTESNSRKLVIPAESIKEYENLIIEKLTPGYWNEYMNSEKITFIFKSKQGDINKMIYSENDNQMIEKLCSDYTGDKVGELLNYLAENSFYERHLQRFFFKG